ncbi:MAG: ABC transporter permease, partial [Longimicrobiales bacterium]
VAEWWRVLVGRIRRNARRPQARQQLGIAECYQEEGMEARGLRFFDELRRDIRYLVRTLLFRDRAFSVTVLLTLGVCIGANVAIYSVVETVVISPLPFEQPDRLVTMYNMYPGLGGVGGANGSPDFFFRRERVAALEEVALFNDAVSAVRRGGSTMPVSSLRVTPSFFPMLGVRAALGRTFVEEEMDVGGERTVILTHGYWQERFGGSADVLGQTVQIDGHPTTIVGVLRKDLWMPGAPEIVLPLSFSSEQRTLDAWHSIDYAMLGRIAPSATVQQVQAEIDALNASLADECCPEFVERSGFHTVVVNAQDRLVRDVKAPLFLLWAGVAFVLLIGCVNVANLMVTRSQARLHELATRMALGAPRLRLARQILTEAVVMGVLGGAVGIGVGAVGLRLLSSVGVENLPRGPEVGLNATVLLYTVALALGASVLFGAIPIVHLFRTDLRSAFRDDGRGGTAGRGAVLLRGIVVTGQMALAFLLLVGAGLMLRSFQAALAVDPGFEPEGVLTARISLPDTLYPDNDAERRFAEELLRQVRSVPGVTAASVVNHIPFGFGAGNSIVIRPEGYQPPPGESLVAPKYAIAGTGYFEAMGIRMLEGRAFEQGDGPDRPRVMIIDESLARRYWPNRSPLGQRMTRVDPEEGEVEEEDLYTVIAVVEDIKHFDLTALESEHVGTYYFAYRQQPRNSLFLVVRSPTPPGALVGSVRSILARLDPALPLFDVQTLENRLAESLGSRRTPMVLLIVFAGVALLLAVVGIYGVLAYSVAQRTREIGIRIALGGQRGNILALVLRQGLVLAGVGLAAGGVAAFFLVRLIQSLLFGVQPMDPLVLAVTALLLGLAAVLACLIPARRATRVDPVTALAR